MTIVVDATVALKWYQREPDSEAALALMNSDPAQADQPPGGVAKLRDDQVGRDHAVMQAGQIVILTHGAPLAFARLHDLTSLAPRAGAIALAINHPAYDCFYLALSEAEKAPLITADRRLIAKLAGTPFAARTLHLSQAAARR